MLKEFKEFAFKGNVIDLAVGVIIGSAFGKIVSSLVGDVLMPAISILLGVVNFTDLKYVITPKIGDAAEVAILYGSFIQSIVDFVIIAFTVFLFVKLFSRKKKADIVPATPSDEAVILEEILEVLKTKQV